MQVLTAELGGGGCGRVSFYFRGLPLRQARRQPIHLASVGASGAEHGGGAAAEPWKGRGEGTASEAGELTRREASKDQREGKVHSL